MLTSDEAHRKIAGPGQPFELQTVEINGRTLRVYKNAADNLGDIFQATDRFGDRAAIVYEDERLTFEDLRGQVASLANWLIDEGVTKGDRIAIAMRNYPEWIIAFWAGQIVGAAVVAINAWWTRKEIEFALNDSTPKVLFADGDRWKVITTGGDQSDLPKTVVTRFGDGLPNTAYDWASILKANNAPELPQVEIEPEDIATILYTSGTTGAPKGALATHRYHTTYAMSTMYFGARGMAMAGVTPPDNAAPPVSLQPFPFFHIGGLSPIYNSANIGSTLVLMHKWNATKALKLIESEGVTFMSLAPTVLRKLVEDDDVASHNITSVQSIAVGSAPVPPDLLLKVKDRFADTIIPTQGYGLTETGGLSAISGKEYLERPESVGKPLPVSDVKIVDVETGETLSPYIHGEICATGPNLVQGYWNNKAATEQSFDKDGWFHTGDIGYLDTDGYIYIVDRLKDVIIRGGENVYSAEVEAVLFEHPAVEDVAVIGLPHDNLGEEVAAIVKTKINQPIEEEELKSFVGKSLAYFKVPERFFFRTEEMPRNATGKILKKELKSEFASATQTNSS